MPSATKKPEQCSTADCINAFKKFVKLYVCANKINDLGCKSVSGKNVTGGQYKISYTVDQKTLYFKPKIHRMWFYCNDSCIVLLEDHKNYAVSHLCHNGECCNPEHLVLESLAVNKSRNCCPAGDLCYHNPTCLVKGGQINNKPIVYWNGTIMQVFEQ